MIRRLKIREDHINGSLTKVGWASTWVPPEDLWTDQRKVIIEETNAANDGRRTPEKGSKSLILDGREPPQMPAIADDQHDWFCSVDKENLRGQPCSEVIRDDQAGEMI